MCLTLENLSAYLGKDASVLLSVAPFTHWKFTKTLETDTPKPLIDYVFTEEGMDFVCDETGRICSNFLYADQARCFVEGIADLPFTSKRHEVIGRLGAPSKSGARISDSILGDYGPWDRFMRPGYVIHVEYRLDRDIINKVTLMRTECAP